MPAIETKNLSKTYEYHKKQAGFLASLKSFFKREKLYTEAVKSINLKIEEGEFVGFLGPNGAGKTTTLKILSGILYPTNGEVKVLGYIPQKRQTEYQKQFSLVMGQKNQLWWDLPAIDSFILNKEIYEISDEDFDKNLEELSSLLDIKDILNIQVRKLSLGQRMKCELVAALLHKPKILFLDEPTIGLDVVAQKNIRDFLKKYNQNYKTTIILTSHYMEDIKELCKRVIVVNSGQIIYDGALDSLINKYAPYKEIRVIFGDSGAKKNSISKYGEITEYEPHSVIFSIDQKNVKKVASEILSSDLPVKDITINEVKIDDVIRKIFTRK